MRVWVRRRTKSNDKSMYRKKNMKQLIRWTTITQKKKRVILFIIDPSVKWLRLSNIGTFI